MESARSLGLAVLKLHVPEGARAGLFELKETFGVPVVEAYAMTEAAHQMTCELRQAWGDLALLGGRVADRHTFAVST